MFKFFDKMVIERKFLKIVNLYLLFILNKGVMNDTDTQKGGKKPQNKRQLFNSTKGFFVVKKEEKEFEFEGHFLHAKKWILIITIQYILSWFTN